MIASGRVMPRAPALSRSRIVAVVLPTLAAVIAAGGAAAGKVDAPAWLYLAIVAAGMGLSVTILVLQQREKETHEQEDRESVFKEHLRWPLPRVSETEPRELGVKESAIARELGGGNAPYAARDKDAELDRALAGKPVVVVVGESGAGKSRTAYEAARRNFAEHRMLVPTRGESLREVLRQGLAAELRRQDVLLWLDDLERYLRSDGFTLDILKQLQAGGARIRTLATLRSQERERILRDDELSRPGRAILRSDRTQIVSLSRTLSPPEREQALRLYGSDELARALETQGLGEYFVAGPDLADRFEDGKVTCPEGAAVVAAAIDWRRAGLARPIPEPLLNALYSLYTEKFLGEAAVGEERFDRGLEWARTPIYATARLLSAREEGFEANDYVLDHVQSGSSDPVPNDVLECIIDVLEDPGEQVEVGVVAYQQEQFPLAQQALEKAIASRHADQAPRAAANLGFLLAERGDAAGAEKAFREAIASRHAHVAPRAAVGLGILLSEQGDAAGAEQILRDAIASGHAREAPWAALNLGVLLRRLGDAVGAEKAYREAIASGDTDVVPTATVDLGGLLEERGDAVGAEKAYRKAIASEHADAAPRAAVSLGVLLYKRGDQAGAERAYREAIASGETDVMSMATVNLGVLLQERGDLAGAEKAFRDAIVTGHADCAPSAVLNLGNLLAQKGDVADAEQAYREAIASGDADAAPRAAVGLGVLLYERGDDAGAESAYRQAIASGHADAAPTATVNLGLLLAERGDYAGAEKAFGEAIDSGHLDQAPRAAVNLGDLLAELGDAAGAERAYREAIASGHPHEAPRAAVNLSILLR
jgi:tetratricopeptide (TPR) repeat protein